MRPVPQDRKVWRTTMTDVMMLCRAAMASLIPHMERARLSVRVGQGSGYAWDDIAEIVYHHFVVETVKYALRGGYPDNLEVPKYELSYPDYSTMSFVEVLHPGVTFPSGWTIFHGFEDGTGVLDQATLIRVDDGGQPRGEMGQVALAECRFRFVDRRSPATPQYYEELEVEV